MENFRDSVQVLVGRGGIQVNDSEHLYRVIAELLDRPETAIALGKMAEVAVRQVSGASLRNIEQIERLLAGLTGDRSSLQPALSPPQVSSTATHG
jgi:3-deoxy-D-manno-octulosonic-acid transferase